MLHFLDSNWTTLHMLVLFFQEPGALNRLENSPVFIIGVQDKLTDMQ